MVIMRSIAGEEVVILSEFTEVFKMSELAYCNSEVIVVAESLDAVKLWITSAAVCDPVKRQPAFRQ